MSATTGITKNEIRDLTITDAQIALLAAILESKIAFNVSTGHHHDGVDSRLVSGVGPSARVIQSSFTGAVNGINKIYTLPTTYTANSTSLDIDGVRQRRGTDYTETSSTTITTATAPVTGATLIIDYTP
jgi:hypothetical protein